MERPVTRHDLVTAIIHILTVKSVPDPESAVRVLGSPVDSNQLFAVIPSSQSKEALEEVLMRVTGHRHPTAADLWILDETQSLALIKIADDLS